VLILTTTDPVVRLALLVSDGKDSDPLRGQRSVEEVVGKRGQDEAANGPQHLGSRFRVSQKKRDSELDLLEESISKSRGLALVIADRFRELAIR
jgi:hypothetical protein